MIEKLQLIHLFSFLSFLILFGILEHFFPLRKKIGSTKKRWMHNLGFSTINTLVARFFFFVTPVSIGFLISSNGIGILNLIEINFIFELIITIILLDFFIYIQHLFAHKVKWFWKIHSIHHSDKTLDVTTALRFHTLEIVISLFIKIFFVILFGFDPIAIVIFEIILVNSAIFNHSNLKLSKSLDKYLSYFFVTPAFHQVHHSVIINETNSNYGFFLSIWDKIFNTYTYHKFKVKEIGLKENKENLSFKDLFLLKINK